MAIGYAHTLYCDRRGCRAKVTVETTRNAAHARQVARQRHGWRCDSGGDRCPADAPSRDAARATTPTGASQ